MQRRTPVVDATGVFHWWPRSKAQDLQTKREPSFHDRGRLSSASSGNRCRRPVPQPFASACVAFLLAAQCFTWAATVTGASAIVVPVAVKNLAVGSAARPTVVTNAAPKDASIIAIGS